MRKEELQFPFPDELIATEPRRPSRVLFHQNQAFEISIDDLLNQVSEGDLWIINETKVLKRRIFSNDIEILFLKDLGENRWEVLFPSKAFPVGSLIPLPEGKAFRLEAKGRPQIVEVSEKLTEDYFLRNGEVPLPPYIQKARGERHTRQEDDSWYQTFWAQNPGSLAAPTASLHFSGEHFELLKKRGALVLPITLHVGLGTFLPVTTDVLTDHKMHFEEVEIPRATWDAILKAKRDGKKIWALGTTVARSLESAALNRIPSGPGGFRGETDLFILPGFEWKIVDTLMTNFHQPESTLLALVAAFAGLENVRLAYQWAIERKFRLFSYGDLSVWSR